MSASYFSKSVLICTFTLTALSACLSGCGNSTRDVEDYGPLSNRPTGIKLSTDHRGGYGRGQCLVCHNTALNVHRTSSIHIDVLQGYLAQGPQYCTNETCHGSNGTAP